MLGCSAALSPVAVAAFLVQLGAVVYIAQTAVCLQTMVLTAVQFLESNYPAAQQQAACQALLSLNLFATADGMIFQFDVEHHPN
jgi:hypothetical protein